MFFDFILLIVGISFLVNYSSRITKAEERLNQQRVHIKKIEEALHIDSREDRGDAALEQSGLMQTEQDVELKKVPPEDYPLVPVQKTPQNAEFPSDNISNTPQHKESSQENIQNTSTTEQAPVSLEEIGGRWLGKIGIVALFFGIGFFLRYAFQHNWIDENFRVILGILTGVGLVVFGEKLRAKYDLYSQLLIGGGIGMLYLSIFGAFSFYHLISQPIAFLLIVAIVIASMVLSVRDDTPSIAVLSTLGAILAPILLSTGTNNPIGLFGYLLILDLGVAGASMYKKWPYLNLISLLGTLLLSMLWYVEYYTVEQLILTVSFATVFFLVFFLTSVFRSITQRERLNDFDLGFILLTPSVYVISLTTLLYSLHPIALSCSILGLGGLYALFAYWNSRNNPDNTLMTAFLTAIALSCVTLALPIGLSSAWLGYAWFVESVLLFYFAHSKFQVKIFSIFSLASYIFALLNLWSKNFSYSTYSQAFSNDVFFLSLFGVVCSYWMAFIAWENKDENNSSVTSPLMSGLVVIANLITIQSITANMYLLTSLVLSTRETIVSIFWAVYSIALLGVGFTYRKKLFRLLGLGLLFITIFRVFVQIWSLGEIYRILSSIAVGIVALAASFAYTKYKDRIKHMLMDE